MILYKQAMVKKKVDRPFREITISLDEPPARPVYTFKTPKDKVKFIKTCESVCRKSMEYKDYIKFLKRNTDLRRCTVLRGLNCEHNKHYTIEIHHEPFTLFDIVEAVLSRRETEGDVINPQAISDEVMQLHYDGKIGLVHLSKTMHQLVHDDKIFIPLQYIYQSYNVFYQDYRQFINPLVEEKLAAKVDLSLKTDEILSDTIDPEFTYIHIDGFDFPSIPNDWKSVMHMEGTPTDTMESESKPQEKSDFVEE